MTVVWESAPMWKKSGVVDRERSYGIDQGRDCDEKCGILTLALNHSAVFAMLRRTWRRVFFSALPAASVIYRPAPSTRKSVLHRADEAESSPSALKV